jgi:RNA polymerase sigma factor (sigma-70 family)
MPLERQGGVRISSETIERAKAGDIEARNEIINSSLKKIRIIAASVTRSDRNRQIACEDRVQDAVLYVPEIIDRFPGGKFAAYMEVCLARHMQRQQVRESRFETVDCRSVQDLQRPHTLAVEQRDMGRFVRKYVYRLPRRERRFILARLRGQTTRQIAASQGVTRRRIDDVIHRGMNRLREKIPMGAA